MMLRITPDFLCLSKGITGGTMPLAVTMTRESIYEAFYAEYREGKAQAHTVKAVAELVSELAEGVRSAKRVTATP